MPKEIPTAPDLEAVPGWSTDRPHPHLQAATSSATDRPHVKSAQPVSRAVVQTQAADAEANDDSAIDWTLVTQLRGIVADSLTQRFGNGEQTLADVLGDTNRHELESSAREAITAAITEGRNSVLRRGQNWSDGYTHRLHQAVFDAIFGLERFQPFVDDETITDLHIDGYDNVWVFRSDGSHEQWRYALASSDAELIGVVQYFANKNGRAFDRANPRLRLALGSHVRLTAIHPPTARRVSIKLRMHRTIGATLDKLAASGMVTADAAHFLSAAVRGGFNVVVSGDRGVGKTTLLRALAHEIGPEEPLVTVESERELHLDLVDDGRAHPIATSLEGQPGSGLVDVRGRRTGEITAVDLVEDSMRLGAQRVIVGEVLGSEIKAMFQVMQSGAGSLSTLHSRSATDAISRMAGLALMDGHVNPDWVSSEIIAHIDFIVHVRKERTSDGLRRWISDIIEVVPSGDHPVRAISNPLFATPRRGAYAVTAVGRPAAEDTVERLEFAGLNADTFRRSA